MNPGFSAIGARSDRVFRSDAAGPPTSYLWKTGDVVVDRNGVLHTCLYGGTPGTWESKSVVIDEVVDFTGLDVASKAMTAEIPAGAVIESVQANIDALVVAGGTTVKVGIAPDVADPDEYGLSAALTKNTKISVIPAPAVLATAETLSVFACATAGGVGDTNITAGKVRVRVTYRVAAALPNAI